MNINDKTINDIQKFLEIIENYLRGENAYEPDKIQIKENIKLYKEAQRLQIKINKNGNNTK